MSNAFPFVGGYGGGRGGYGGGDGYNGYGGNGIDKDFKNVIHITFDCSAVFP